MERWGEFRDPGREVPPAIMTGLLVVAALYLAINWVLAASPFLMFFSALTAASLFRLGRKGLEPYPTRLQLTAGG